MIMYNMLHSHNSPIVLFTLPFWHREQGFMSAFSIASTVQEFLLHEFIGV